MEINLVSFTVTHRMILPDRNGAHSPASKLIFPYSRIAEYFVFLCGSLKRIPYSKYVEPKKQILCLFCPQLAESPFWPGEPAGRWRSRHESEPDSLSGSTGNNFFQFFDDMCRLVEVVLAGCFSDELPAPFIGDKAYDSDPSVERSTKSTVSDESHPTPADETKYAGRSLRRYRRRRKAERSFAWLHNFTRDGNAT